MQQLKTTPNLGILPWPPPTRRHPDLPGCPVLPPPPLASGQTHFRLIAGGHPGALAVYFVGANCFDDQLLALQKKGHAVGSA